MPNMDPKKCPMPSQDPNVRNKNFKEVALGYTAEMAVNEAKRCLQCKKPACRTGCPVQIDIPAFIAEVAKGDFEAAYQVIAAGEPVRGQVRARHQGRTRRHWPPGALCG